MTVLDTILEHKRSELDTRRAIAPLAEVQARARDAQAARDFLGALGGKFTPPPDPLPFGKGGGDTHFLSPPLSEGGGLGRGAFCVALIAEVKKASPSAGVVRADFDPFAIAREYEAAGAACLSVLTDERFFQGHDTFLQTARSAVSLPVLRKDFIVNEYQIYEARALGADAVLLIVAALSPSQVKEWAELAQSLGMAALVEVHTEAEMEVAVAARCPLIGINARDLRTFATDLAVVGRLSAMAAPGTLLVAESGLRTPADVQTVRAAGAGAVLVGEAFMRAPDIGAAVRALMGTQ